MAPSNDFRFLGKGPAASSGKQRTITMGLGQAFCRYFLYQFCGVTYFAHMDKVLNKATHPAFEGMTIKRVSDGDTPDYLCARKVTAPFIAEAKGRFSPIHFSSPDFAKWRNQFSRITVLDKNLQPKKIKGYISATSFATEQKAAMNSKMWAEDPETAGEEPLTDNTPGIGLGCLAIHYSRVVSKLGLNLLADSLDAGFVVPPDLSFNLPVWRCIYPPLDGHLFFGGFFSEQDPPMLKREDGSVIFYPNILRLDQPTPTFYGVSVPVMEMIRQACQGNWRLLSNIPELPDTIYNPSNLAWLRDGSISGSLEFFELVGTQLL